MPDRPPVLRLSVQIEPDAGQCPADRRQFRRWAQAALDRDATITLRLVGRREGRALNARFRGRDYATNVLTFEYEGETFPDSTARPARPDRKGRTALEADIVICLPVVRQEAKQQRKSARDHLGHLVIHGMLHAQGMDHENDDEAEVMEARETRILRRFRIQDPYMDTPVGH
jgi:probable rRNA maturation factor